MIVGTFAMASVRKVLNGELGDEGFRFELDFPPGSTCSVERHLPTGGIVVRVHSVGENPINSFVLLPVGRSESMRVILSIDDLNDLERNEFEEFKIRI